MLRTLVPCGLAAALLSPVVPADAHATFEKQQAAPGAAYKAVLRLPHGCDGEATHTVRIAIPEGVFAVKPMPKAGWRLTTTRGAYARSYDDHGTPVSEGVTEIAWSDGELPDDWYDEFVFQGAIADLPAGTLLAFPTVQLCANGQVRWDEVAAAGQDPHELAHPAPTLTVLAQGEPADGHAGHAAMADSFTVGDLVVEAPWARESVTRTGAAYMVLRNNGDQADRLIGISSDVAETAQLHSSVTQDGVMQMREVDAVEVPAHGEAVLGPGGLHVMLIGLKGPLEEGESFPLTLQFEKAGEVQVMTTIEDIGHAGGSHEHSHGD